MLHAPIHSRTTRIGLVHGLLPSLALLLAGCGAPQWVHEYNFGQQLATNQSKPMLLYFADFMSTEHRTLERDALQAAPVRQELAGCVNVYLAYQWGPAPRQFNVHSPHVFVLCRPDGSEVDRLVVNPTPTPDALAQWLRETKSRAGVATSGAPRQ